MILDKNKKLLGIYITAGVKENWLEYVQAAIDGGADFVEIGLPFSDPIMDGPIIQAASVAALDRGVTTESLLNELSKKKFSVPLVAMTYYNVFFALGLERAAKMLEDARVGGTIVPDLPVDVADEWEVTARKHNIANVLLVAPSTPDNRAKEIAQKSDGFVYAVGLMGVTGVRTELAASASELAKRIKQFTDTPVLIGVGISTGEQAQEASQASDGVIVGSAVMKAVLDGLTPTEITSLVSEFRI
jgi:tryptophan synthase alpha chain